MMRAEDEKAETSLIGGGADERLRQAPGVIRRSNDFIGQAPLRYAGRIFRHELARRPTEKSNTTDEW